MGLSHFRLTVLRISCFLCREKPPLRARINLVVFTLLGDTSLLVSRAIDEVCVALVSVAVSLSQALRAQKQGQCLRFFGSTAKPVFPVHSDGLGSFTLATKTGRSKRLGAGSTEAGSIDVLSLVWTCCFSNTGAQRL